MSSPYYTRWFCLGLALSTHGLTRPINAATLENSLVTTSQTTGFHSVTMMDPLDIATIEPDNRAAIVPIAPPELSSHSPTFSSKSKMAEEVLVAQIIPDNTLGSESSHVSPNARVQGQLADVIDGGAVRGPNLLHSFQDFNIDTGQRVYFANPSGIMNILTRVTGETVSDIDGTLGVDGSANLFLLNPNGIVFGPNAQLDLRGSFVGSTASSIPFANGGEFSATNSQDGTLLSVSVPLGVQHGAIAPGSTIVNRGTLATNQDLTLIADRLNLQGTLEADGDLTLLAQNAARLQGVKVKAGSNLLVEADQKINVRPSSTITSGRDMTFRSPVRQLENGTYITGGFFIVEDANSNVINFVIPHDQVIFADGDVQLTEDYSGESLYILAGGKVALFGGGITIDSSGSDSSVTEAIAVGNGDATQMVTVNSGSQPTLDIRTGVDWSQIPGGLPGREGDEIDGVIVGNQPSSANIILDSDIDVEGNVLLSNQFHPNSILSDHTIRVRPEQSLQAINIDIKTGSLYLRNGSIIETISSEDNTSAIDIQAQALDISNNSFVRTSSFETGNAGDIRIDSDSIILTGGREEGGGIFSTLGNDSKGKFGGNITIETEILSIKNGAEIDASTSNEGDTGNIFIRASESILLDGDRDNPKRDGRIPSGIVNEALRNDDNEALRNDDNIKLNSNSGSTTIITPSLSIVNGAIISTEMAIGSGKVGDINIIVGNIELKDNASLSTQSVEGSGGDIDIAADSIALRNNSSLNTQSEEGSGGNINVNSNAIELRDNASLITQSGAGNGGDILLKLQELLLLRNESEISTTAFASQQEGDGGNITIAVSDGFLIARENSDIVANAFQGNGGQVSVTSIQALGLTERDRISLDALRENNTSDISASSDDGVSGDILIENLGVDPSQGLSELPVLSPTLEIQQNCSTNAVGTSRFNVSGRGGVPLSPTDLLSGDRLLADLGPNTEQSTPFTKTDHTVDVSRPSLPERITEAQRLVKDSRGQVTFTAQVSNATSHSGWQTPVQCGGNVLETL